MITTNVLYRTFFIKAEQYGTAFTIDVDGSEYLITARHLLDQSQAAFELKIFLNDTWQLFRADVVGHCRGEIDISVLRVPSRLTPRDLPVTPSMAGITLGADVFFLGFPYKMWGDVGGLMGGMPCAFAKKGIVSSFQVTDMQMLHIDAINNEGFSGGPLFFFPQDAPGELRIAGVVSKYRIEHESVLDSRGDQTDMSVPYNTGFLAAYGMRHALDLIRGRSSG